MDPLAPTRARPPAPVVVAVMDGVGWGPRDQGNAVHLANTPHLDRLWTSFPTRSLRAHGTAVGLPSDGDMGNSEVGHNALGAGRVVQQGASLVNQALAQQSLFQGETWRWLVEPLAGDSSRTLHLCGLLSDGNVHAHFDHVVALVEGAAASGVRRLRLHALADGRDVVDRSYERWLSALDEALARYQGQGLDYHLASGGGRMVVTMDRYEADWEIVARGWRAHVLGKAAGYRSWQDAVKALRSLPGGQSDQTLGPFCIVDDAGEPVGAVQDGDSFVLWNFRGDRAVELTRAFEQGEDFRGFDRQRTPSVRFAGMMQYDGDLALPRRYLVAPPQIDRTMGVYVAEAGLTTLAVSETQKFGHVTYFWNGNRSEKLAPTLERYVEVPSDRVSFDERPAMQAAKITDVVLEALNSPSPPSLVRLNWANGDMVGHTGNLAATVTAVEAVDTEVGRLVETLAQLGGVLLLTADHGNADDMWMRDKSGAPQRDGSGEIVPKTSHTLAPVPCTIVDFRRDSLVRLRADLPEAGLANVAATVLALLGLEAPEHMEPSLLET